MARRSRKRRMRCPKCRSLSTVRNGSRSLRTVNMDRHVQRSVQCYRCRECGEYFSCRKEKHKKYSFGFKTELARMHVEERMSYRVMSKRIREKTGKQIGASVLCGMVNEVARQSKSSWHIQHEYRPEWTGYLVVDDKYLNKRRKALMSLVAIDSTGDAIHSEVLEEPTQESVENFFLYIRDRLEYPIKGITTDMDDRLRRAIERVFAGQIPHQVCIWHALESIRGMLGYGQLARQKAVLERQEERLTEKVLEWMVVERRQQLHQELERVRSRYDQQRGLLMIIRQMLYSKKRSESFALLKRLESDEGKVYPQVIAFLKAHLDELTMHQQDHHLEKTSNRAENFNKQLQRRFKTIESFQTPETAFNYLNLLRNYLRFKPFTDCRVHARERNGRAPIELCNVKLAHHNWLRHAVRWV